MLLTISTTNPPATDLGFLLHKHPDRVRTVDFPFGPAHVFFPEAGPDRCTVALLVEVDPIGLVRRRAQGGDAFALASYVNDRPYAASSLLSVVLAKVFGTAMTGRCEQRPELAAAALPFEVEIPVLPARGGEALLRSLFEPLGHQVRCRPIPLDGAGRPGTGWGMSRYFSVTLTSTVRLADLLSHLYVLLPVLDDDKHYWVGEDEARKLAAKGGSWLAGHPARQLISRRYLNHRHRLADDVLAHLDDLTPDDPTIDEGGETPADRTGAGTAASSIDASTGVGEEQLEGPLSLNQRRLDAVARTIAALGATRVLDLGCGEGRLIQALLRSPAITLVTGADVSPVTLARAEARLDLADLAERQRSRVQLIQGGLTYRDARFTGHDVATLVEVIEHLDPPRLAALEQVVFGHAAPPAVIVTTPNREHNVRFASLPPGQLRHRDHRFEWTRAELDSWAGRVAEEHGYQVRIEPIGDDDPSVGPPTQMAVFTR